MTFRANHSCIKVRDADRSAAFYREAFGFELAVERRVSGTVRSVFVCAPGETVLLQLLENGECNPALTGYGHFSVSVEDVRAAYARHVEQGFSVGELYDLGYQLCYFIADPDGYETEVIQPRAGG